MTDVTIEIPKRFCGPPRSANGGYVGGSLAAHVETTEEAPAVSVRLFAPPPLEQPLALREVDGRTGLFEGEVQVARAEAAALDLAPPPAPDYAAAAQAVKGFRGFHDHPFPRCFVCGPDRPEGDGLRIFPGPAGEDGLFAAPWTPDESLREDGDALPLSIVWASLDCTSVFSFPQPEENVLLLGEMRARAFGPVRIGEPCVVTSWYLGNDGRKHRACSSLHGQDGACLAYAQALWIEVDPESVPRD